MQHFAILCEKTRETNDVNMSKEAIKVCVVVEEVFLAETKRFRKCDY